MMDKFDHFPILSRSYRNRINSSKQNNNSNNNYYNSSSKKLLLHTTFVINDTNRSKICEISDACNEIPKQVESLMDKLFQKKFNFVTWKSVCVNLKNMNFDLIFDKGNINIDSRNNAAKLIFSLIIQFPIQIARGEQQSFQVMYNGENDQTIYRQYETATQVSDVISFGCYDGVISEWKGPIRVVSSMGKQSTGKSYLLNHLFGTKFDISGMRCTDGSWLSLRIIDNIMYITLDFEGLGSTERTLTEDTLLSVFNSAVSNCTLFKAANSFDSDIISMFNRFEQGMEFINNGDVDGINNKKYIKHKSNSNQSLLFQGILYICVKDVQISQYPAVVKEFGNKITNIILNHEDGSFAKKMYQLTPNVKVEPVK